MDSLAVVVEVAGGSVLFLSPALKVLCVVREACSWQGCVLSASKASRVDDCFKLMEVFPLYSCGGECGMGFEFCKIF